MPNKVVQKRPRRQLPNLCRICLTGSNSMINLTDFLDTQNTITILEALEKVMNSQIVIAQEAPDHLCAMCLSLLRISYDLRTQFEETQRKIWENTEKNTEELPKSNVKPEPNREVDLIYRQENYSLSDILIVEDEEHKEDLGKFLQNLGETVSVKCVENKKESELSETITKTEPNNKVEFEEMFVIQTVSENETEQPFHWEHEYAKSTPEVKKKGGRKNKYPELMEEINSLIIEGDVAESNVCFKEQNKKGRKMTKFTDEEMKEIEKYIIHIGDNNKLDEFQDPQSDDNAETNESHIQNVTAKDEPVSQSNVKHICHLCHTPFVTKSTLNRHLRVLHNTEVAKTQREKTPREVIWKRRRDRMKQNYKKNPMLCQICGHVAASAGGARYHSLKHTGKQIQCDLCPRTFFTPTHLKHHRERKHEHKTSKHLCPLCGEYRNSSTALAYHMKLHMSEEKKYVCQICGLKFVVKSALTMHLRRHNGDRRYPCEHCSKSFFSSHERRKHAMTHTGEKPHKCKYCEKRFISTFNKRVHTMTHDGPYECDYCDKCFIDIDVLNMHLKYKHHFTDEDLQNIVPKLSLSDDEGDSNDAQILEGLELLPPEDDNLVFEED